MISSALAKTNENRKRRKKLLLMSVNGFNISSIKHPDERREKRYVAENQGCHFGQIHLRTPQTFR
jgi:hypothetical protein